MSKTITICLLVFMFTSCGSAEKMQMGKRRVVMDSVIYLIPQKYILQDLPESLVPKGKDMDKNYGLNLSIPLEDLGFSVDTKKYPYLHSLIILFSPRSHFSGDFELPEFALQAWYGEGQYKEKIVDFDKNINLYRIYPKSSYPVSWQYFRSSPEINNEKISKNDWVSSCHFIGRQEKMDMSNVNCDVFHDYKTVVSQITFPGDRIKDLDKLLKNYEDLLRQWEEKPN